MFNQTFKKYSLCLCFVLVVNLNQSEAVRIFSYQPIPFDSHQTVFKVFTDDLVREGHELVALTPLPRKEPMANIIEIDVHEVSYSGIQKWYDEGARHRNTFGFQDYSEFVTSVGQYIESILDIQLGHPQMQGLLQDKTQTFDLLLIETAVPQGIVLNARFKAPILLFSTMTVNANTCHLIGATTNHYYYPDWLTPPVRSLSFWKRVWSLHNFAQIQLQARKRENYWHASLKKHIGEQVPTMKELKKNVAMLFLNAYRFWDNNRPTPIGSVLYIGGFHLQSPKSLPEHIQTIVDNSEHGIVVMCLGSKLKSSSLPTRSLRIITNVFSRLPYDFIWKWDSDEFPNKPDNVHIVKDLPQNDLLYHAKVRAFITHCGLLSTHEAIAAKVPLVGLPMLPDHWVNTWMYEKFGIGIHLDIDLLNEEDLRNAIVAVVEEKKFRENIARLSNIASDTRENPLKTASRWALRLATTRGARYLRSPLADTTFGTYYMLDVMLIATSCTFIVCMAIFSVMKRLIKMIM